MNGGPVVPPPTRATGDNSSFGPSGPDQPALSAAERALLDLLASRPNVAWSRDDLLAALPAIGHRRMVDVIVWRLRSKLAVTGSHGALATVWGRGYALLDSPLAAGELGG